MKAPTSHQWPIVFLALLIMATLMAGCASKRVLANAGINQTQVNVQVVKKENSDSIKFMRAWNKTSSELPCSGLLYGLYANKAYQPILLSKFLADGQLNIFLEHLQHIEQHGLSTDLFPIEKIQRLLDKSASDKEINNKIELELLVASALIRYSMALQFGTVNPAKVYQDYAIPTLSADSSAVLRIFNLQNLKNYLDSIQPKEKNYLALQKALSLTQEDTLRRTLIVNLERFRWKNRPVSPKFVSINIPSFILQVIEKGKIQLQMKVCVGEAGERATPQIGSMIYTAQVNPVWNIPQSIAKQEISKSASEDRYYLANNNIKVYQNGKLVQDPEQIDWTNADLNNYMFQQQPGDQNSLGKIKFLFQNRYSVYLHDTPFQAAFKKEQRAISHGCVRVEKPIELAYALFGKGQKYQQIKSAMQSGWPSAKYIALLPAIPIRLFYYTAVADASGNVKYFSDIYNLDQALYRELQKANFSEIELGQQTVKK